MNNKELELLKNIRWIELHFTDLAGYLRSVTVASHEIDKKALEKGMNVLDGSSVEGFTSIDESDLRLRPVMETLAILPWREHSARVFAEIFKGDGRYPRDPRYVADKALEYLDSQGLKAYFGPEVEFMLLSNMSFDVENPVRGLCYRVESWEYPATGENKGFQMIKKAYHTPEPFNAVYAIVKTIAETLEDNFGFQIEAFHHEVAAHGQAEIDFRFGDLRETADRVVTLKYVARNIAARHGLWAVFMPKPFAGDNGNGMHTHVSVWDKQKDVNLFYDQNDDYAQISQLARYFIGGLIEHGRALAALVAPTVNSYRRLVPGYEAPVYLVWSKANRSAAIRIPSYGIEGEKGKRIEFRPPDPSANPYLAFAAILAAGLDGVKKKIEPGDPVDKNVYSMSEEERRRLGIKELPGSLEEALDELETDNEFLKPIFTKEIIEGFIELKRREVQELRAYPSAMEVYKYFTL